MVCGCPIMKEISQPCCAEMICDECGNKLCELYPKCKDVLERPEKVKGHYHRGGEVLCVECFERVVPI